MASTIITKNSSTASATPAVGDLQQGELAVNVTDKKVYTKDSSAAIVKLVGSLGNQEASAVAITGGSIAGITDLAVADGGTGSSTAAGARSNLSAAASGANSDITSLSGLTTALSVAQGGTGVTTSTGTGSVVLSNSPTLVTPALGTPSAAVLTNATGLPLSTGISGLGTGVATFLGTPSSANLASAVSDETGSGALVFANSPTLVTPALGTPSSATLTNATGLPISTGVSGLGTGVATFLATPSSANLASAVSDETGSGALVFANSPTLVTPALGTPSSGTLTNATGLPISTGVSGLGTGVATALAVNVGSAGAPVVNGGALGTPSSGTVTNLTGTASININGTVGATTPTTGAFTTVTASSSVTLSGGTANGVTYLNGSKVLTSGSALTFDGTSMSLGSTSSTLGLGTTTATSTATPNTLYLGGTYSSTPGANAKIRVYWDGTNTYGFGVSGTTGLEYITSNTAPHVFFISGSEQMRLTSTGLGIGTSSPAQSLHVKTSTSATPITLGVLSNATGLPALSFNGAYASTTMAGIYANGATSTSLYYEVPSGNSHFWGIADSTKMTLDSAGNLGLGVTPSAWNTAFKALEIKNTAGFLCDGDTAFVTNNAYFNTSSSWIYKTTDFASRYQQQFGKHTWYTAASGTAGNAISFTQAMTLDASGRLQIGTTTAGGMLTVVAPASTQYGSFDAPTSGWAYTVYKYNGTAYGYLGQGSGIVSGGSATDLALQSVNNLVFATGGSTERARIDSSGNLLVGTTTASSKLTVNSEMSLATDNNNRGIIGFYSGRLGFGTINAGTTYFDAMSLKDGNLLVGTTSQPPSGTNKTVIQVDGSGNPGLNVYYTGTGAYNQIVLENGNGVVGRIQTSGSATSYLTSSDYRMKNSIAPMTGALAKVAQLKPVTYKWKVDGSDGQGFIAHELAEVVPDCVSGEKDAVDADGNPKYQGIDTSFLVATVVAALQELKAEFDAYKASHP